MIAAALTSPTTQALRTRPVRKAVFPVAGLGTRFLPITKACPKEMLNVVDKPLIQYAVEEAIAAGITELIFVTGRNKRAIEDHFDTAYELESELIAKQQWDRLKQVQEVLPSGISCVFIRQPKALGLGHAIACTRALIGEDETFAVVLADDIFHAPTPILAQLTHCFDASRRQGTALHALIGVAEVPLAQTTSYGVIDPEPAATTSTLRLRGIVEKPAPEEAPSQLAVMGRYLLPARIFRHLAQVVPGKGGEIQLTDAIASLLREEAVYALPITGKRYDCGSKLGYLEATLAYGVEHPEVGPAFREMLRRFVAEM